MRGWISPALGVRFELMPETLEIYRPDGEKFLTYVELGERLAAERKLRQSEQRRIQALEEKLRELGVNPELL